MRKPAFKMSALSRIYLVAIVAIVIPSLVLIYFGYQLIGEMRQLMGERQAKTLRTEVRLKVALIENDIVEREQRILNSLDLSDPEMTAAHLATFEKTEKMVEQFFLLDSNFDLVYPKPQTPRAVNVAPPPQIAEDDDRRKGEHEEFVKKNPRAALTHYLKRLDDLKEATPIKTTAALSDVAGVCFKLGDFKAAADYYRQLVQSASVGEADPAKIALAKYQMALAQTKLGDTDAAVRTFLDLYEDLVEDRLQLKHHLRTQFFKQRTTEELEKLASANNFSEELSRRYVALKREAQRKEKKKAFLDRLNDYIVVRLRVEDPEVAIGQPGFQHLQEQISGEYVLIAYTFFPNEFTGEPWLLGFKTDLDFVKDTILAGYLQGAGEGAAFQRSLDMEHGQRKSLDRGTEISVTDRTGSHVWGAILKPTEDVVTEEFPSVLQFWKLGIVDRDPNSPLEAARKFSIIYTSLNLLIFLIILVGVVLTIKDMKREIEISKLKSDFVSNVSHELKTPLSLIRMYAETLQMGRVQSKERVRKYYDVIIRESEQLTWLINNVLDFSRIESGRRLYQLRDGDIGDVVTETVDAYHDALDGRGFEVRLNIQPDLPLVPIDRNAISQALVNLLNNAVKYSQDEKVISVDVRQDGPPEAGTGPKVLISVSDRGIGISEADQEKIFDIFYRSSDYAVRRTKGTGLGLAIVKHAAEAHNGEVHVQSEIGVGSTFTILLPLDNQT